MIKKIIIIREVLGIHSMIMFDYSNSLPLEFITSKTIGVNNLRLLFTVMFLLLMVRINGMQKEESHPVIILDRYSFSYKLFVYLGFVFAILVFGNFGEQEYLYGQFLQDN